MFKKESNREETKSTTPVKGDSKKKQAQPKKNDNHATQDIKGLEGVTEEKFVAGPVLMGVKVRKSDIFLTLKVKESMSNVNTSIIEDLQKDSIM